MWLVHHIFTILLICFKGWAGQPPTQSVFDNNLIVRHLYFCTKSFFIHLGPEIHTCDPLLRPSIHSSCHSFTLECHWLKSSHTKGGGNKISYTSAPLSTASKEKKKDRWGHWTQTNLIYLEHEKIILLLWMLKKRVGNVEMRYCWMGCSLSVQEHISTVYDMLKGFNAHYKMRKQHREGRESWLPENNKIREWSR